eukprot:g6979.t1
MGPPRLRTNLERNEKPLLTTLLRFPGRYQEWEGLMFSANNYETLKTAVAIQTAQASTLAAAARKLLKQPELCVHEAMRFELIEDFLGFPVLYQAYYSGSAGESILDTLNAETAQKRAHQVGLQESKKVMSYFLSFVEQAINRGDFRVMVTPEMVRKCPTMWNLMADCSHVYKGMIKRGFQIEKYCDEKHFDENNPQHAFVVFENLESLEDELDTERDMGWPLEVAQPPFAIAWSKIKPRNKTKWQMVIMHKTTPVA